MIEKPKILIVEDESIISMDLKMNLETMGYIVCGEIAYAEEVLEKVKATHPNIILMDITLKGKKSGIDTAKELYPTYDIPVIYISSEINHERLKNTKIPTTYGYLVKPIREDALYSTIEITMDKYRLQKEVERKNEQLERANEEYERANEELNETIKIVEKSKKTIQKSESKFKTLFHSIGDIAVVFDSENNVIEANDNACRKLGYNRNELLNMNLVDFQSSEDNKQIDYRKKHLADENRCYFEATLIGKQGKHIPVEVNIVFVDYDNQKAILAIGRDVTERKKAQKEIEVTNRRMEMSLNVGDIAWWEWDLENDTLYSHYNRIGILGYDRNEIDPRYEDWIKMMHPVDREHAKKCIDRCIDGTSDKYELEYRIKTKNGDWLWIYDKGTIIDKNNDGKPVRMLGVIYNINQQKEKEQELKRIGKILQETNKMAKVGGWEADIDNYKQRWTEETYRIHEVENDFIPTIENGIDFFHPEDKPIINKVVTDAIKIGNSYDVELRLITAKGNLKWVRCIGRGVIKEKGINTIHGTIQDITEKKLYQMKLEKQAYYIENAFDGIISTDMNFKVITWNKGAEKIYGWSKDEITGKDIDKVLMTKLVGTTPEKAYEKYMNKGYWEGEIEQVRKDGKKINIYITVVMLKDKHGKLYENLSINRDITNRKHLEERIKHQAQLIDNVNDAIITIEKDMSIKSWNKGAEKIYGWTEKEVKGENLQKILPSLFIDDTFENILGEIRDKGWWKGELFQQDKEGNRLNINSSVNMIKDKNGQVSYYIVVNRDVSHIKEIEQEIKLKNKAIENSINAFDIVNEEKKFVYVNKAYLDMWGYDKSEEVIGTSPISHCYDENTPKIIINNLKKHGRFETEFVAKRKDGSKFQVRLSAFLFKDANGEEFYAGSSIDITERKRVEKLIKERQSLLNSVFNVIPDGICIIDKEYNIIECNHVIEKWHKDSLPLVDKKCYQAFFNLEHKCKGCPTKESILNKKVFINEKSRRIYNGTKEIWNKIYSYPLKDEEGNITGVLEYIRDITEEKELLKNLSDSESKLKEAEKTAHIGYYEIDLDSGESQASEETYHIFGLDPDSNNGLSTNEYSNFIYIDDREKVYRVVGEAIEKLQNFYIEFRVNNSKKEIRDVYCIGKIKKDDSSKGLKIFGTIQDITEQKELQRKLSQSEHKYKALFENANDGIGIMDNEHIVDCNTKFLEIYGCKTKDEIIGKTPDDFSTNLQPDGIKSKEKSIEKINKALSKGGQVFEWKAKKLNGEVFDAEVSLNTFNLSGKKHVLTIVRDITRRKKLKQDIINSKKQLSSLIDNIRGIFYRCLDDKSYTMIFISKGCYKLTGYKDEDFYDSKITFNDIIHEDDREYVNLCIKDAIFNNDNYEIEYRIITKNNELKWVWERGKKTAYDNKPYLEGYIADITDNKLYKQRIEKINTELERKIAERTHELETTNEELTTLNEEYEAINEELRSSNHELEQAVKNLRDTQAQLIEAEKMSSLGNLVAGVAHEINTPLGIAVMSSSHIYSNLQKNKKLYQNDDMTHEDLINFFDFTLELSDVTKTNLNRVAKLVNSFKQISVDQSIQSKRKFNIKKYIEHIILSMTSKIKNTNHEITVEGKDDILINSYPDAFFQIITNLVNNSLIHGFEGIENGKINITLKKKETELILMYKDNGVGITKNKINKIFEPFYTTKRNMGGTGLGLNIIYNIVVQKLKGKITCNGGYNKGITFQIRIPLEH